MGPVVLGDARLRLRDAPAHGYGLIVLDAFSSDSVPVHLLTREAAELYRRRYGRDRIFCAKLHHQNGKRCIFCETRAWNLSQDARITSRDTDPLPTRLR